MTCIENHQLIDGYVRHQRVRSFSRETIRRRNTTLRAWIGYLTTVGVSIDDADTGHVEAFIGCLRAAETRKAYHSDLRLFYAWAVGRGLLESNPVDALPVPRIRQRGATPVDAADVRRLIDTCEPRARLAVMLGAMAGLRVSEMARLRGEDVRLAERMLLVRGGKGGADDPVPLAAELAAELAGWPERGPLLGGRGTTIGALIRRNMRRLEIEGRPHDLRHSFLTAVAQRSGGNIFITARLARHRHIAATVRYVHWHTTGHDLLDGLY